MSQTTIRVMAASSTLSTDTLRRLAFAKAEGSRYDVHCLDAPHVTPGPLSDYYDGRDWQFRGLAAAKAACRRANREAASRGDGLRFVVLDLTR